MLQPRGLQRKAYVSERPPCGLLESHSHNILIQFGLTLQCRSTLGIIAEQNISHFYDCTCGVHFYNNTWYKSGGGRGQSKRPHSKMSTTRTATLSGITTRTATLLWSKLPHYFNWSKRPHRMVSYQNGHAFLVKMAKLFWSKRSRWALPKWAEVATKTATLHLVKTATNSEW